MSNAGKSNSSRGIVGSAEANSKKDNIVDQRWAGRKKGGEEIIDSSHVAHVYLR